ncbi:hypothetical protein MCOR06_009803 [Pyricularia oryzae]|nr:hypothetical protein MCOR06_009803 [Pyricularia oryzae]
MVGSGSKSALSELSRTPQLLVAKNNREHGCQFQADYEPKQPLKCHVKCRHSVLKACENEHRVKNNRRGGGKSETITLRQGL